MSKKKFITAFTRTDESIRDCQTVKFTKPSLVKKSLSYAVDINTIYDNFCKTGKLPLNGAQPLYDENFVKYDSLIEAQKLVDEASAYFQSLPAKIKNQYGNSLEKFVYALNAKDDFLIKEGLLNVKTVENVVSGDEVSSIKTDVESSQTPQTTTVETVNTAMTD